MLRLNRSYDYDEARQANAPTCGAVVWPPQDHEALLHVTLYIYIAAANAS